MRRNLGMCVGPLADRSGIPGIECDHTFLRWQQLSQSKISSDSHVNSRLQSTLTRAPSNRSQSRTNQSLASRLSKNAASSTSDFGHKRTFRRLRRTSALPPKADIGTQPRDVRFVPIADIAQLFRAYR